MKMFFSNLMIVGFLFLSVIGYRVALEGKSFYKETL